MIRNEDGLSRDIIKHLNFIEENILESIAWQSYSYIWQYLKENSVPVFEEVIRIRRYLNY